MLAHFIIPEVEVIWDSAGLSIVADDQGLADSVRETCQNPPVVTAAKPADVDVAAEADRPGYERTVAHVQERIAAGVLEKAIVSRQLRLPFRLDLPGSYLLGLSRNTPTRSFLLQLGDLQAAGFSPELVAVVSADGTVATQPLAGTRPLGPDSAQNRRWRAELLSDAKENYEHCISVRLAVEQLTGVCEPASVTIPELLAVKERGTVQHLGSKVRGHLQANRTAWDAFAALFPAVTASGAPKHAALDTIRDLEESPRGLYGGAVCVVGPAEGEIDAALVLRTLFQDHTGSWLQAGAGIVPDSRAAAEFDETANKLRSAACCVVPASASRDSTATCDRVVAGEERRSMTDAPLSMSGHDSTEESLRAALLDLGIDEVDIVSSARLRTDLGLDSTEVVQISLELGRRCGSRIKLESVADYSITEICEFVDAASAAGAVTPE